MKKNAFIMSVFCNSRVKTTRMCTKCDFAQNKYLQFKKEHFLKSFQTLLKLLLKNLIYTTSLYIQNTAPDVFRQLMFDKHIIDEYFYINFR